jgi:hypothetical protein
MINRLSVFRLIHTYWIAACQTWKLSGLAFMSTHEREKYVQRHVLPRLRQQTLAAALELSIGQKPYDSINMLIDAVIASRLPEFPVLDRA